MCSQLDRFLARRKVTGRPEEERRALALSKDVDRRLDDATAKWEAGGCPLDPKVMEYLAWLDSCQINFFLYLHGHGWEAGEFERTIERIMERDMSPEHLRSWAKARGIPWEAWQ